jgi:hypothetical protein
MHTSVFKPFSTSLGDIALLSEEAALRRGSDAKNLVHAKTVAACFFVPVIGEILHSLLDRNGTRFGFAVAFLNFILLIFVLGTLEGLEQDTAFARAFRGTADVVRRHVRPWIIGFIAVQYLLVMIFGHRMGWAPWSMLFPIVMLGFRFAPSEVVLLHGFFEAVAVIEGLLVATGRRQPGLPQIFVATTIFNLIFMAAVLMLSRRFRRNFVSQWSVEHGRAVERQRMRDELDFAREVQLSMLPDCAPTIDWLDVAALSLPATEVGGDYFDYFRISERKLAIVCGDVAGHGLASGIVLAALRAGFTLLRDSLHDPVSVLSRLDELVTQTSRRRMLVSLAIVLLDADRGVATIASAGHPPVICRRRDGTAEAIEMFSPPLGVKLKQQLITREVRFAPGDAFILHTDGIYEAANAADESYGFERLLAAAEDAEGDAAALRDAIVADVAAFRGAAAQSDDVTIVVARVR